MTLNDRKIDLLFRSIIKKDAPGACLAVLHHGQAVYKNSWGLSNVENPAPLTPQSIFNTGSLAKQFTAYCVLLLQQQRKLSLEDDVRKHIPELPNYGKPIRLRHLLWHTSGLRCYTTLLWWAGMPRDNTSRRQALELVFRQKELNFEPGSDYLYGNSNYLLLSEVVQRLTRRSLAEFAKKHIFDPLGMKDTHFREDVQAAIPRLASGHFSRAHGKLGVSRGHGALPGVGRLMTHVEDLARWDQFQAKAPERFLGVLRGMLSRGWLDNGQKIRYGGGLMIQRYRGLNTVRHDGAGSGCRSEFCRFPDQGFTFICLSNHDSINATWMARQVANQVFGRAMEPVSAFGPGQPAAPPARFTLYPKHLRDLSGLYRDMNSGAYAELDPIKGGLRFSSMHTGFELKPESANAFQGQGHAAIYRLDIEPDGGFILIKQGRASRYDRMKPLQRLPEAKLERYVGRYASPELLARIDVVVKDSRLVMVDMNGTDWPLTYVKAGHFFSHYRDLHFTKRGMVMESGDGWVRKLKWVRL